MKKLKLAAQGLESGAHSHKGRKRRCGFFSQKKTLPVGVLDFFPKEWASPPSPSPPRGLRFQVQRGTELASEGDEREVNSLLTWEIPFYLLEGINKNLKALNRFLWITGWLGNKGTQKIKKSGTSTYSKGRGEGSELKDWGLLPGGRWVFLERT